MHASMRARHGVTGVDPGQDFPLEMLEDRLRCPRYGSRYARVLFEPTAATKLSAGSRSVRPWRIDPDRYTVTFLDVVRGR
jgi:hypothetical protein